MKEGIMKNFYSKINYPFFSLVLRPIFYKALITGWKTLHQQKLFPHSHDLHKQRLPGEIPGH